MGFQMETPGQTGQTVTEDRAGDFLELKTDLSLLCKGLVRNKGKFVAIWGGPQI